MIPEISASDAAMADQVALGIDRHVLLGALRALDRGDFSVRLPNDVPGIDGEICDAYNRVADLAGGFRDSMLDFEHAVARDGKLSKRVTIGAARGGWGQCVRAVNEVMDAVAEHAKQIARIVSAVGRGELSRTFDLSFEESQLQGDFRQHARDVNATVSRLAGFVSEVTRVAQEVGVEGKLGAQARVDGIAGEWRELTDAVNLMAGHLTAQVHEIARITTAVARGDLTKTVDIEARGEILALKESINTMVDQLSAFADEVTRVARDVGIEGKLGGQADVPGAAGIWSDLTSNMNELAGNLTRQVRAISDVATAVTNGDLTQSISVEARGEVALLKDNINQMIRTLAETTRLNEEEDWLKTNLTRFTRMLQGQRDLLTVAQQVLSELAPVVCAQHGVFYIADRSSGEVLLRLLASYGLTRESAGSREVFAVGEGLVGQAAADKTRILIGDVPAAYVRIGSGLGGTAPRHLVLVPIVFEGEVKGVIELASIHCFTQIQLAFLEQLFDSLGIVVATIEANMRSDTSMCQSQRLARELQVQQEELRQTNEELEEKARQLIEQKGKVERKNLEVGLAKQEIEEKAHQLALTSRYKSQFLANMSHELRTPLNGLLILSKHLANNPHGTLREREVEYARTIYQSGADLLTLINEILDLAKIQSGTMATQVSDVVFRELREYVERAFRHVAEDKELQFRVELDDTLPDSIQTDDGRLRQVLRNLLSNAFKFTEEGSVTLRVFPSIRTRASGETEDTILFTVADTGIGIPEDKQLVVFEAFQQADGGTSRKYGGTGLGLAISREIAGLLHGDLIVESRAGEGSAFTLRLPRVYAAHARVVSEIGRASERARHAGVQAVEWPAEPRAAREALRRRLSGRTVLVVDDDVRSIFAVTAVLEQYDVRVLYGENGYEALETLGNYEGIDAVLMDIIMPELDGYEATRRLRAMDAFRTLPVIALTAQAMKGDREKCLAAGASDYVTKPVDPDELVALLARWLDRSGAARAPDVDVEAEV
jgi:signal transduction histidine kinase/CheY-like chemotaxis protein/HAMP domain-containing protein